MNIFFYFLVLKIVITKIYSSREAKIWKDNSYARDIIIQRLMIREKLKNYY